MRYKVFMFAVLLIVLAGCDKVNNITDDELVILLNDVGIEYDLVFEPADFNNPESVILVIYSPEESVSNRGTYLSHIPYTECYVDDITKLEIDITNSLLFSAVEKDIIIFMYYGLPGDKDCDFYTINDDETISFKQYDITVPLGNILKEENENKKLRYVVFVPRWTTLSNVKTVIDDVYKDISENFSSIISEVSNHIALN